MSNHMGLEQNSRTRRTQLKRRLLTAVLTAGSLIASHDIGKAADFNWTGATGNISLNTNWSPTGVPATTTGNNLGAAHFADAGAAALTLGNVNFWTEQFVFESNAQAYTLIANSGTTTYLSINATTNVNVPTKEAIINNSDKQQVINVLTGKLGISGYINTGTTSGGALVINGPLGVADSSTSGVHYTSLKGSNSVYFNVDTSINAAGNTNGGAWTSSTVSQMYRRARGRFFMTDFSGTAFLGNIGTSYTGTFHLDSSSNGALRLTNSNVGSTSNGAFMIYGGTTHNGTLELVGNTSPTRSLMFLDGRSGAVADDPHVLNVSGNNTLNITGDWETGTYVNAGTTADEAVASVQSNSGNWNIQSDSGKLTLSGGTMFNTTNAAINVVFTGAGDGLVNTRIANYQSFTNFNIVKKGSGTWTATNIASSDVDANVKRFSGAVTANGGLFRLQPVSTVSLLGTQVVDGGRLGLTSFSTSATTLSTAGLTLVGSTGSGLDFELAGTSTAAPLVVTTTNGLTINGTNTINVSTSSAFPVGQFTLIDYDGSLGGVGFNSLTLGSLPLRVLATLVDNTANTSIDLNVTGTDTIRWNGSVNGTWNVNSTANWKTVVGNAVTTYLQPGAVGDVVAFDDNAVGNFSVNVAAPVNPASITFNNTTANAYTIGGSDISTTSITVNNNGNATLSNVNLTATNGIAINGGGMLNLATTGTLTIGGQIVINSGTLKLSLPTGTDASPGTITTPISGSGVLRKEATNYVLLNGNNSAFSGTFEVANGVLRTSGNNALVNTTVLPGGTLDVRSNGTANLGGGTKAITINGTGFNNLGALITTNGSTASGAHFGSVTLAGNSKMAAYGVGVNPSYLEIDGPIVGNGFNLEVYVDSTTTFANEVDWNNSGNVDIGNLTLTGGGILYLANNTYLVPTGGNVILDNGILGSYGNATSAPNHLSALDKPVVVNAAGGGLVQYNGTTVAKQVNSLITMNGDLEVSVYQATGSTAANNTTFNNTTNTVMLNGKLTGSGGLTTHLFAANHPTRLGKIVLISNDNDYAGTTTIGGGGGRLTSNAAYDRITLSVGDGGSTGSLGSGAVIVNAIGTLQFNRGGAYTVANNISGAGNITATAIDGVVTLSGTNTLTGNVTVSAGTLDITGSHTTGANYSVASGANLITTSIRVTNALTLDGNATVYANGGTTGASKVETLTINAGGKLNLKDNDLVVGTGTVSAVRDQIKLGLAGASGITSDLPAFAVSTGFGYALGSDTAISPLLAGSLTGQAYDADSVLVKYTFLGDADLDGDTDLNDLGLWAQSFTGDLGNPAIPVTFWTSGDFDYDGDTDLNDLGFWAGTFTGDLGGGAGSLIVVAPHAPSAAVAALNSMGITVVPEPGTVSLFAFGIGAIAWNHLRRRQVLNV